MPSSAGSVQSVERAFDVLEALYSSGGAATISDIAATAELPVPTAYRLARTMVERGYIRRLDDRRYCLGFRLVPLGNAASTRLGEAAARALRVVALRSGESANLAVLSGNQAEYIQQADGTHALRLFTEVGRKVPLHSTGVGKVMLAGFSDEQVLQLLGSAPLNRQTAKTITDRGELLAEIGRVREQGYAIDDEEMEIGVRCVALSVGGTEPMAVSASGPSARMTDAQIANIIVLLRKAAAQILRAAQ